MARVRQANRAALARPKLKKDGTPAKKRRARSGRAALREILRLQGANRSKSHKAAKGKDEATMLLIPKSVVRKNILEVAQDFKSDLRFEKEAMKALHVALEDYGQTIMTDAAWISVLRGKKEGSHVEVAVAEYIQNTKPHERNAHTFPVNVSSKIKTTTRTDEILNAKRFAPKKLKLKSAATLKTRKEQLKRAQQAAQQARASNQETHQESNASSDAEMVSAGEIE
jgi:histone H3/H4